MGLSLPPNARLLLLGLLLGLSSLLYPRLVALLPSTLPVHSWRTLATYHHSVPIASNHDPFDLQEPLEEKLRRLGSTGDGGKEKEERRLAIKELEEVERRAESAGSENKGEREKGEWPVWLVLDAPEESPVWPGISRRIESVKPPSLILLYSTPSARPLLSAGTTSSSFLFNLTIALSRHGFLPTEPSSSHPAPSVPFLPRSIPIFYLGIPASLSSASLEVLSTSLIPFRHSNSFLAFSTTLSAVLKRQKKAKRAKLHWTLGHHSAHPRLFELAKWQGKKKDVEAHVWVAVGVAGASEGEELVRTQWGEGDGDGKAWRFGEEPIL